MSYYTDITSPNTWTLLWRVQVLSYHVVCVLHNMFGEEICYNISSETIDTVIWLQPLPFHSHFRSDTILQFFLGKSWIQQIGVHFQLFEHVHITEFGEEVVVQLKHSQFCVLKIEGPNNDWLFVISLCFGEFCLHGLFFTWSFVHMMNCSNDFLNSCFEHEFELFTTNSRMPFFVTEALRYSVSATVHNLITIGTNS